MSTCTRSTGSCFHDQRRRLASAPRPPPGVALSPSPKNARRSFCDRKLPPERISRDLRPAAGAHRHLRADGEAVAGRRHWRKPIQ